MIYEKSEVSLIRLVFMNSALITQGSVIKNLEYTIVKCLNVFKHMGPHISQDNERLIKILNTH